MSATNGFNVGFVCIPDWFKKSGTSFFKPITERSNNAKARNLMFVFILLIFHIFIVLLVFDVI